MRKITAAFAAAAIIATIGFGGLQAHADNHAAKQEETANVKLSEQQKNDLAALHKDILTKKKELIGKYVQYGIMTQEKGKTAIERMDQHYTKLEKNGFIPKWEHHDKNGKHEKEGKRTE